MLVDGCGIEDCGRGCGLAAGGEQGPDDYLSQQQGGEGSKTLGNGFIAARLPDLPNHVLAAEFLEIVGGAARSIFGYRPTVHRAHLPCQLRSGESLRRCRQRQNRLGYPAHPGLVQIDSAHCGLAHPGRLRQVSQSVVADEAGVHAADRVQESLQDAAEAVDDLREAGQRAGPSGVPGCCAQ